MIKISYIWKISQAFEGTQKNGFLCTSGYPQLYYLLLFALSFSHRGTPRNIRNHHFWDILITHGSIR